MPLVLVIESDPIWRYSIGCALSTIPEMQLGVALDLAEAAELLDLGAPALAIIDLDLGADDIDAPNMTQFLDELLVRRINIPTIFTTVNLSRHASLVPAQPNVAVKQKPLSLSWLRDTVATRCESTEEMYDGTPFGILDYVQLACSELYSVEIEVAQDDLRGRIQIYRGELWSARTSSELEGEDAFFEIAHANPKTRCTTLQSPRGPKNIDRVWQHVIMDYARKLDERTAS